MTDWDDDPEMEAIRPAIRDWVEEREGRMVPDDIDREDAVDSIMAAIYESAQERDGYEPIHGPDDWAEREVTLANRIRDYRSQLRQMTTGSRATQKVVPAEDVALHLEMILARELEPQAQPLEVVVEYRHRFTVTPPDLNEDGTLSPSEHRDAARDWFLNHYQDIVPDVVEPGREPHLRDKLDILTVRPKDD